MGGARFFVLVMGAILLTGCGHPTEESVIVLHTGRLRGNVYPPGIPAPLQHYPFIAGTVDAVRKEAAQSGAKVILIDLGDSLSGSFAAHATDSANVVEFFNALDYDAVVLSNLDAQVSPEILAGIKAPVLTPFAAADGSPAAVGTTFSTRFVKQGLPVTVYANFYGDASPADFPERFPKDFAGRKEVFPVRDFPAPGPTGGLTLLTWMKLEDPSNPPGAFLQMLRAAGIDAILAHRVYGPSERETWQESGLTDWIPPASVNILRNNGGFVLARLDLTRKAGDWKVVRQRLIPMTANGAAAVVPANIAAFGPVIEAKDSHLADLSAPMDRSAILATHLAALASLPGVDAALSSPESIRSDWPAGELRASGVFNALPWTSPILRLSMPREEFDRAVSALGLTGLLSETAGEPLTVATSGFFAELLKQKLGLAGGQEIARSEFDWFSGVIAANPSLLGGPAAGWKICRPGDGL